MQGLQIMSIFVYHNPGKSSYHLLPALVFSFEIKMFLFFISGIKDRVTLFLYGILKYVKNEQGVNLFLSKHSEGC